MREAGVPTAGHVLLHSREQAAAEIAATDSPPCSRRTGWRQARG